MIDLFVKNFNRSAAMLKFFASISIKIKLFLLQYFQRIIGINTNKTEMKYQNSWPYVCLLILLVTTLPLIDLTHAQSNQVARTILINDISQNAVASDSQNSIRQPLFANDENLTTIK